MGDYVWWAQHGEHVARWEGWGGLFGVRSVRISDLRGRAFLPDDRFRICHGHRCLNQVEGKFLGWKGQHTTVLGGWVGYLHRHCQHWEVVVTWEIHTEQVALTCPQPQRCPHFVYLSLCAVGVPNESSGQGPITEVQDLLVRSFFLLGYNSNHLLTA